MATRMIPDRHRNIRRLRSKEGNYTCNSPTGLKCTPHVIHVPVTVAQFNTAVRLIPQMCYHKR